MSEPVPDEPQPSEGDRRGLMLALVAPLIWALATAASIDRPHAALATALVLLLLVALDAPRWELPRVRWALFAAVFWPFALPGYLQERRDRGAATSALWGGGGVVLALGFAIGPYFTDGSPSALGSEPHRLIDALERCGRVSLAGFEGHYTLAGSDLPARICEGRVRWQVRPVGDEPWTESELCFSQMWPAEGGIAGEVVYHPDVFSSGKGSAMRVLLRLEDGLLFVRQRRKDGGRPEWLRLIREKAPPPAAPDGCVFYRRPSKGPLSK